MSAITQRPAMALFAVLTAACLAVSAYVHLDLAKTYDPNHPSGTISEGTIFRIQGIAVIVIAALLLLAATRLDARIAALVFLIAAVTMGGSALAVLVTRYNDVGKVLFIPDMYEPVWFFKKSASAIVEGGGAVLGIGGAALAWFTRGA